MVICILAFEHILAGFCAFPNQRLPGFASRHGIPGFDDCGNICRSSLWGLQTHHAAVLSEALWLLLMSSKVCCWLFRTAAEDWTHESQPLCLYRQWWPLGYHPPVQICGPGYAPWFDCTQQLKASLTTLFCRFLDWIRTVNASFQSRPIYVQLITPLIHVIGTCWFVDAMVHKLYPVSIPGKSLWFWRRQTSWDENGA